MDFLEYLNDKSPLVQSYEQAQILGKSKYFDVDEFCEIIDYYYFSQEFDNARDAVQAALSIHPQSFDILLRQARVCIEFKKFDTAIDILKRLLTEDSSEPEIYLLLGFSYISLGKLKKAEKAFGLMLDLAEDEEDRKMFLGDIAYVFFNKKHFSLAYKYYKKLYELDPTDSSILYEMAFCLERQNRNKESRDLYIKYLKENPFVKIAWYNLGVVYTKLNEPHKAIEAFDYALAIDPDFSSAIYNKAHILFELKQYKKSIDYYKKLLKLEKNNPSAYFFIAKNYIELKQYKLAIEYLKKALKRVPYFPQAWFEIGRIFYLKRNYNQSKKFIIKALKQGEIKPEYLKLLGKVYTMLKDYTKAERAYRLAAISNPFDDEIWYSYSEIFEKSGDINKAIDILLNGKDFVSNKANFNLKLAKLYFSLGDTQKAQHYVKEAQNNDKNNTVSNFLQTLIRQNDRFAQFINKSNV